MTRGCLKRCTPNLGPGRKSLHRVLPRRILQDQIIYGRCDWMAAQQYALEATLGDNPEKARPSWSFSHIRRGLSRDD